MSDPPPAPERRVSEVSPDTPASSHQSSKPRRVLACMLCQQRKVKCDRKFPCAHCVKAHVQCVPGVLAPRRRRRRFPERDLLDRVRKYEDLLRQNNIPFESLHGDAARGNGSVNIDSGDESNGEQPENIDPQSPTASTTEKRQSGQASKNIWHAMSRDFRDNDHNSDFSEDDTGETAVKRAWDQSVGNDEHLMFCSPSTSVDLSTFHPDPVQIFRLWQIYLDNVNPLLKVTHTPSLQGQIIEAAGNVKNISPTLEALMFGIYCMSVLSLSEDECQTMFGAPRENLLVRYQFGAQQALMNCAFLRTSDRDCLTAFVLYLISIDQNAVPQSLATLFAMAIRIAQRMAIHTEVSMIKYSVLEAEMRRRLWWALVIFDTRIIELSSSKVMTLEPSWDCRIPLNVNDSDLRPEMKGPPTVQGISSESLFVVVRGLLGDFVRSSSFYLEFTNSTLKLMARKPQYGSTSEGDELSKFEEMIESQYLRFCNQENPVHFMTVWWTRCSIAKYRLLNHHSKFAHMSTRQSTAQRDTATSHAIGILECDTKVMTSPLTKGFLWLNRFYFPFIGYLQICKDLRERPTCDLAAAAWDVMSQNLEAWFEPIFKIDTPVWQMFIKIVLQAWQAREAAFEEGQDTLPVPKLIEAVRDVQARTAQRAQGTDPAQPDADMNWGIDQLLDPMQSSPDFFGQSSPQSFGVQDSYGMMAPPMYPGPPGQFPIHLHMQRARMMGFSGISGHPGWSGF